MGAARIRPADPNAALLPYQADWIKDDATLKFCEKSRQIGMSWTAAYACVERAARRGARHDQWVSSRDDALALQFIEDSKFWAEILELAAEDLGEVVLESDPGKRITARRLRMASGRSIYGLSSNPDAQAGRRGSRVLDEFALHPDPRKLYSIAEPGLTWGGQMEIISTHRGSANFFNELASEIVEGGNPKRFSHHRVTLEDALNQGLLWRLQQKLSPNDERQEFDEAAYFAWVRSRAADEETFQQEYMCKPADDNAAFLLYDLIASCEYPVDAPWSTRGTGRLFAGVDIGRKIDLSVLWILEELGDVLYTRHVETMHDMRKSEQEAILWPWFERCDRICIDNTGLGIGWVDDAQDKFGGHRVEGVTFTAPIKETLAYALRGSMEDRRIRIPHDPKIRADLRKIKKTTTAAGNIRFEAESDADGHADRFWALALAKEAASGASTGPIEHHPASLRPTADLHDSGPSWQSDLAGYN